MSLVEANKGITHTALYLISQCNIHESGVNVKYVHMLNKAWISSMIQNSCSTYTHMHTYIYIYIINKE